ncbi:hypothetical protein D3C81_2175140 [compost metagenome]
MTGLLFNLRGIQHPRFNPKVLFELAVVQARVTAGDQQDHIVPHPQRQGLGNLPRFNPQHLGGQGYGGRTGLEFQHRNIRGVLGEKGFD